MRRRDNERAADVDREAVAERLYQVVADGRLELDEFDERVARTYAAKTYGELDRLVEDLPRPAPGRVLTAMVGGALYFWPAWVALPWRAVLLGRSVYGVAAGQPQHWATGRHIAAGDRWHGPRCPPAAV